ncbi:Mitochondrial ATPase complex subunit atp10, partial [Rhizophlyctis rosea]
PPTPDPTLPPQTPPQPPTPPPQPASPVPPPGLFTRLQSQFLSSITPPQPPPPTDSTTPLPPPDPLEAFRNPQRASNPGFFERMETKVEAERKALQAAEEEKRAKGMKTRASAKMTQRVDKFLDEERNLTQRRELLEQAFKEGYFDEHKEVAKKGEKLWEAPARLRSEIGAPPIPNIKSTLFDGTDTDVWSYVAQNKVTLVSFVFSAFGDKHVDSYMNPFRQEFANVPGVSYLQVAVEENATKAKALQPFLFYVKWKTEKALRPHKMMHFGDIKPERHRAGMKNSVVGWVNLVDEKGRVRWQAHGPATEGELASLRKFTRTLAGLPEVEVGGGEKGGVGVGVGGGEQGGGGVGVKGGVDGAAKV